MRSTSVSHQNVLQMMRSTRCDRIGCSVEVTFGRRRAEGGCGSSKEGCGHNTAGSPLDTDHVQAGGAMTQWPCGLHTCPSHTWQPILIHTLSSAAAIISPIASSLPAEMDATLLMSCRPLMGVTFVFSTSSTWRHVLSMPLLSDVGFAPAVTA
eukprot:363564-Chlamydomonas_euryale.AAC.19